jgi:hypothetical protein
MGIEGVIRTLGAVALLHREHSRSPVSFGVNAYSSGNPATRTSDKWQTGPRVAVENLECIDSAITCLALGRRCPGRNLKKGIARGRLN